LGIEEFWVGPTSHTSAHESVTTVAPFRAWRGLRLIVAREPVGTHSEERALSLIFRRIKTLVAINFLYKYQPVLSITDLNMTLIIDVCNGISLPLLHQRLGPTQLFSF